MKRLIVIGLIISLLVPQVVYGQNPTTVEEAVRLANEEIEGVYGEPNYYDISQVNKEVWEKYGLIVYGEPHGDKDGDDYRYIGYTPDGDPFSNPTFRRDDWAGGTFDERNWIESPWDDPRTKSRGAQTNMFNNADLLEEITSKYSDNMRACLLKYYPEDTDGSRDDWHKYMHILQPPTEYSPGVARMWHVNSQGQIWYTTMTLPSNSETIKIIITFGNGGELESPPLPAPPVTVYDEPRSPNVAIKWDTIPLMINKTSPITSKVQRDSSHYTWNEYRIDVTESFQGQVRRTVNVKNIGFNTDFMLKAGSNWYDLEHGGKANYTAPSNSKPGAELITRITVKKRVDNPNVPKMPRKPSRPSRPSSPGEDATASERSQYRSDMAEYRRKLAIYQDKMDDWNKLKDVHDSYFPPEVDSTPSIISVGSYNYSEYRNYHVGFNDFVNRHYKRYVSIEGSGRKIIWFTKASSTSTAESKNVIIHKPDDLGEGGLDPGIIINPPQRP